MSGINGVNAQIERQILSTYCFALFLSFSLSPFLFFSFLSSLSAVPRGLLLDSYRAEIAPPRRARSLHRLLVDLTRSEARDELCSPPPGGKANLMHQLRLGDNKRG